MGISESKKKRSDVCVGKCVRTPCMCVPVCVCVCVCVCVWGGIVCRPVLPKDTFGVHGV